MSEESLSGSGEGGRDSGRGAAARPIPPLATDPARNRSRAVQILVLVGLVVYANSLGGAFVYDDLNAIVGNPHIRHFWPVWETFRAPAQSPLAGRPAVSLSFAITYGLGGLNPWIHRAFNVVVHILSTLILFEVVRRTLEKPRLPDRLRVHATGLSCIVALIWMVHPLQTESVDYLTQRTELLMGLFYLLTLYCSIRSWDPPTGRCWSIAAVGCCALGMCSKEVMASAPLAVLLYDRAFVAGSFRDAIRRHRGLYGGLAATWLVFAGILYTSPRSAAVGFHLGISSLDYLRTQAGVIAYYLRLSFWPHPLVLSYSDWPIAHTFREVVPSALLVLLLLAATAVLLVRNSPFGFAGAWFFMILTPSSSFVPIVTEIVAERRMYLPLAAVVMLVVLGGYASILRLVDPPPRAQDTAGRWAAAAAILLVVALAGGTIRRNSAYGSAAGIWQDNVAHRPADAFARTQLGAALLRRNDPAGAERELREAVRLKPSYGLAHLNLGASLVMQGDLVGARKEFAAVLEIDPNSEPAHTNMGLAMVKQGRTQESVPHFREAARIAPHQPGTHMNLGRALIEAGQIDDGIRELEESLKLRPDRDLQDYLARLLSGRGRPNGASLHSGGARHPQR